jgi:dienelactone hydrolase
LISRGREPYLSNENTIELPMFMSVSRAITMIAVGSCAAIAQAPHLAFPVPSPDVTIARHVVFGVDGGSALRMDVYQLPAVAGKPRPAFVFFNRAHGAAERQSPLYVGWARTAASRELVGIVPDLRDGSEAQDFQKLIEYLTRHGGDFGVDTAAIAVYAASGNVATAFPILEDPRQTAIKAAVIYYGTASITTFRRDLPVLYVRAGLDRPNVNQEILTLASRAITQNAPVTLLNHATGYHGFELFNDDDATHDVIARTLMFVIHATWPGYRAALAGGLPEAAAAGSMQTGDYHNAVSLYADMVRHRPDDARLHLSYGEALLADRQFATACTLFDSLKNSNLGPRDLGVPASRACAQAGNADAAIAWIASIPERFRPTNLASDPAFAAIQSRSDFRALLPRR